MSGENRGVLSPIPVRRGGLVPGILLETSPRCLDQQRCCREATGECRSDVEIINRDPSKGPSGACGDQMNPRTPSKQTTLRGSMTPPIQFTSQKFCIFPSCWPTRRRACGHLTTLEDNATRRGKTTGEEHRGVGCRGESDAGRESLQWH